MSDYAKALTDFWSAQGQAMLRAQEQASLALTEGMQALMTGKFPTTAGSGPEAAAGLNELAKASEAVAGLWSSAASLSAELGGKLAQFAGADKDSPVAAVLRRIADPRQWMSGPSDLDEALGRIAEGPRFADLMDMERRYAKVMQAWAALRRQNLEHSSVMLEAWVKAGREFAEQMTKMPKADSAGIDPKRALSLWTDLANRILLQTQRSDRYMATQRQMIRAATDLRVAQQDLIEHFGKQYGFPTRTELDDVHRSLTEMRREMRKLRRAQSDHATPAQVQRPTVSSPEPAKTGHDGKAAQAGGGGSQAQASPQHAAAVTDEKSKSYKRKGSR